MAFRRHLVFRYAGSLVCAGVLLLPGAPTAASGQSALSSPAAGSDAPTLIIRTDDVGMSHSVNLAVQRLIDTGLPLSVSVMFACPWYQEAVEILKQHPSVSVGIHLVLNSEWRNYRWGPVAGRTAVPTLVDSNGYFFQSAAALHQNQPSLQDVETELRAQIERALRSGVKIDYVDAHMGTAESDSGFRAVTERLARDYGLGIVGYLGEQMESPQYWASPRQKADSLIALIDRLRPGVTVVVTHVGLDDAELSALIDMNTDQPLPDMSRNRQGELDALTSSRFTRALKSRNIRLLTFRDLIHTQGLAAMRRPAG